MDKVLDKLGLYDIIAILLSGMVIVMISSLLLLNVYKINIANYGVDTNNTFVFLLVSYFTGLIFQELGSLFQEIICKFIKNKSLAMYKISKHLNKEKYKKQISYRYISENEFKALKNKLKCENQNIENDDYNTIYYYCKFYTERKNSILLEKLQSLAAMSRSFVVYFLLILILSCVANFYLVCNNDLSLLQVLVPPFSAFLLVLFYVRFVRFQIMRTTRVFRDFIYYKDE